jgi:hypothetical protein
MRGRVGRAWPPYGVPSARGGSRCEGRYCERIDSVASLRVHLRSYRYYPSFVRRTFDVFKELPYAAGLAGVRPHPG